MERRKLFKTKKIISGGKVFLRRLSIYLKKGSLKIHIIQNDDMDEHHSHPWDFESFILFGGYVEETIDDFGNKRTEDFRIGDINKKKHYEKHKTKLHRFLGIKIPAVTIGYYSDKLELCSFCKSLGYCKLSAPKILDKVI